MAIGHRLPFVRANAGGSVLHVSQGQQRSTIVDQWLPALLPEVSSTVCCVLLQVREPTQTEKNKPKSGIIQNIRRQVCEPAEGNTYTVFLSGLSSLQENSLRMAKYERFGGAGVSGV